MGEDRYHVIEKLGGGSQGETFLAEDQQRGRQVVLKRLVLKGAGDWNTVELFEQESALLRSLDHPAIPKYVDAFNEEGSYTLVQEYFKGDNLKKKMEAGIGLDRARALDIADQMLKILDYLHHLNPPVVHRDIKPSNILVSNDGKVALIDFGVAQTCLPDEVGGSTVVGTSGYMAPEQFMGRARPASDLYALGATIVHLLTGKDPIDIPVKHLRLDWHGLVSLPKRLVRWLDKLLAPDGEDRFAGAREALDALEKGRRTNWGRKNDADASSPWKKLLEKLLVPMLIVGAIGAFHLLKRRGDGTVKKSRASVARKSARPDRKAWCRRILVRRYYRKNLKDCIQRQKEKLKRTGVLRCDRGKFDRLDDLKLIAHPERVVEINVGYNQISDLSPLARFRNLSKLWLHSNQISDLRPLAKLTSLTFLQLEQNRVADLSPLAGLTSLWRVYLGENRIADLSPLKGWKSIKGLTLRCNRIVDLAPLAGLVSLVDLNLNYNDIVDLNPLKDMRGLRLLRIDGNLVRDIAPLASLTGLRSLQMKNNLIRNISPLRGVVEGNRSFEVYLTDNCIRDFSPVPRRIVRHMWRQKRVCK